MGVIVTEDTFGSYEDPEKPGEKQLVRRFTVENGAGMRVQLLNYGATIHSLIVPDSNGQPHDVVFGFADFAGYLGSYGRNPYFGAAIGRVANRIEKAQFKLGKETYTLEWKQIMARIICMVVIEDLIRIWESHVAGSKITFSYLSRDGEGGFPGEALAQVTYELNDRDLELTVKYQATTTKPTPICLTNHSYFNLSGHQKGNEKLKGHFVTLNADKYTPVNDKLIPTGELKPVANTEFDFRTEKNLGTLLAANSSGYDHNFCVNQKPGVEMNLMGKIRSEQTKLALEVYSNQPGIQFYTSNFLPDSANGDKPLPGKNGAEYWQHGGICMETQSFPNAINQPDFPSPIVNPGEIYRHTTLFKFVR